MIKSQTKYLIVLYSILFGIIVQLGANINHPIYDSSVRQSEVSQNLHLDVQQSNPSFISSSFIFNNRENFIFDCDEKFEDDDDKENIASQKKNIDNSFASSFLFYNPYSKLFSLKNSRISHFSRFFLSTLHSKLFIIFQVFRI